MKKRKVMSILVLLIAVVALGFGYALTTKNLTLNGTATAEADDSDFDVKFTASQNLTTGDTNNEVVTDISYTDTTATFTVVLDGTHKQGKAKYTISNLSTELRADVKMGTPTITGDTTYFTVTPTWTDTVLNPSGTVDYTIQVDLVKTPITEKSITITVPFTADAMEAA